MSTKKVENAVEETVKEEVKKVKLKILIAFTDKYTNEEYKIGDTITVNEKRAKELLDDARKLVSISK